ncbi:MULTISPECIES: efflux RND transporter periplasmic adaptor subunit [Cellulophaga]|jgi:RND family efflux transporter MFP subunit|uniref:RND family efflux transporter, MFP subunit n=3 Tax=Cellulophaga baltica TaxID=76594 RepID=A0A1G7DFH1_9FLAO|nr:MULTISPECIES: efflux RND transporter periplasmic adaptor subunit [Cellulophaga]AIZ41200.1 RND transporter [Cellulophaga baltica 18]KGK32161.1 RND transporter [Cellulophaga sp. E6(2014)]MBA6313628.1 efflux RND transporter periplasmic adaptor subunit [Cellulophaga baltica]MCR1023401.1 efflux RND transporter periplasmic adaptor subunit [Cellulophaga baltica]SDE50199.1 RND family efflux transporter, MFP subunit [Cellulophaga baltica]
MKKLLIASAAAFLLVACGGDKKKSVEDVIATTNPEEIRTKRAELVGEQQTIHDKIKQLDEALTQYDTVKKVPLITTITAKNEVFNHYLELQGNVTTKDLLVITPEYNGILTNIYVKEGQNVRKGQILGKIDDGGLSQQVAQLEIQAELAKTTFERQKRLWDQQIGSEIQYLQAKSTYEAQSRAVAQLQQQIAKTVIRAPFSGTIDDVITEQGSVVAAGQSQIMRIVNLDHMYIETDVPENYITNVSKGKSVEVEFPILGKTISTKIRQAGDFINPSNRTFKVEVGIPSKESGVKPNLTARLKINDYTNENAVLIPQSIISENADGEQYVYLVSDKKANEEGVAKKIIIKTGKTQGDVIEVLEGLENGAEIIKEGARSVEDGQTVKVINL